MTRSSPSVNPRAATPPGRLLTLALLVGLTLAANTLAAAGNSAQQTARAIFAGGCFWCMEPPFDRLPGVISTTSGYIGGHVVDPTYEAVSQGGTGHAEAVEVVYDPQVISFDRLLYVFWRNVDPVAENQQFCDKGSQYRSAIFYLDDAQRELAQASKAELEASGRFATPIATRISRAGRFYPAENYHQDYYVKNPIRYKYYRTGCGRDRRLQTLWGDEAGG